MKFSTSFKRGVQITGVGVVGGFGSGADELAHAMANPMKNPMEKVVPAAEVVSITHPCLDDDDNPCLALKADTAQLERFIPKRALRRIDQYSRLALLGAHLALEDAGVDTSAPLGERVGLVIASGHGALGSTFSFLDTMIEDGDAQSSPTHFSNSVHNAAAAYISMQLGITGPNLTVSQQRQSVTSALAGALGYLAEGEADAVLFGAVDEVSPVYSFGNDQLQGEGATFFWLVRGDEEKGLYAVGGQSPGRARYGEVELLRVDEGAPRDVVRDFDLLLGDSASDGVKDGAGDGAYDGVRLLDTSPIHGCLPTRAALDLAACALEVAQGGGVKAIIERQGESCAVVAISPK